MNIRTCNHLPRSLRNRDQAKTTLPETDTAKLQRTAAFILEDIKTRHGIKKLSRIALLNDHDLKIRFRQFFGKSLYAFLVYHRLQYAKHELATTDKPIQDIAAACGYNAEYFTIFFRKKTGYCPTDYRRQFSSGAV